eukprot:3699185-Rhodomonas_salina.2
MGRGGGDTGCIAVLPGHSATTRHEKVGQMELEEAVKMIDDTEEWDMRCRALFEREWVSRTSCTRQKQAEKAREEAAHQGFVPAADAWWARMGTASSEAGALVGKHDETCQLRALHNQLLVLHAVLLGYVAVA